jgi:hypothetical protein
VYYYLEVLGLLENASLEISSGDVISPDLMQYLQTVDTAGKLYSQYPSIFSFVALPFVFLFGISGFFIVNSLSLVGVIYFQGRMIKHISKDSKLPSVVFFVLIFGSYFWYYSQAIWPHMFSIFAMFTSAYYGIMGKDSDNKNSLHFLASGLLLGIAIGSRLDSVFALPAIGILCFFHKIIFVVLFFLQ